MNKTKKISYIIIWVVFIVLLLFSNTIVASFRKNNMERTHIKIEEFKKDQVYYAADEIDFKNDIFDSFIFKGWVYCETNKENNEKTASILLANDNQRYIKALNLSKRTDVTQAFKEKYKIRGSYHGIQGAFSTVGVKNGIYNVYIYCRENNENYGLVDTGMKLKKDGKGISEYKWESTKTNISVPIEQLKAKSNLDSANISGGYLKINGWVFVDGFDTANQSVYIRLLNKNGTNATYNTQSVSRPDVGAAYKNNQYNNSGFKAVIPADEVSNEDIEIELLVKNNEKVYLSSTTYMYSAGTLMEKGSSEAATSNTFENDISAEIEINSDNIDVDSNLKYHFDSCVAKNVLAINGWAYIHDKDSSKMNIFVSISSANGTTRIFITTKKSRPDVAKAFGNELYTESGFQAKIPLNAIAKGDNTITVIAESDEIMKAEKTFTFAYN
ncbi:MAG: hypothetical protein ACOYIF_01870 [Acetivibrionales bacterium]|jgi:hypothetical protein